MAIELQNKVNVQAPSGTWPYGKTLDDTGANDGTPLNHDTLTDYIQFFAKIASAAGITFNGLPDNDVNGWQYFESLKMVTRPGISVVSISASALMSTYTSFFSKDFVSQLLFNFSGQGAAITFDLDAAANVDDGCLVILKNNGDYTVTVSPAGGEFINGAASFALLPGAQIELMLAAAATNWVFKYGTSTPVIVGGGGGAPAYGAAWSNSTIGGGGSGILKFRKNSDGLVTIEGAAARVAGAGSTSCFTLPVGFRPAATKVFAATITDGVTPVAEMITISSAGVVQLLGGTGLSGYYPASNFDVTMHCSFYAAD